MTIIKTIHHIEKIRQRHKPLALKRGRARSDRELQAIQLREEQFQQEDQAFRKELESRVGKDGLSCFDGALSAFKLNDKLNASPTLTNAPERWQEFGDYYNHELYSKVLPLCQLADLIENKGDPEKHAFKLSIVAGHLPIETALNKIFEYLEQYQDCYGEQQYPFYEACSFELPRPSEFLNFERWRSYAMPADDKSLLLNPIFQSVFPNAEKIERLEEGPSQDPKIEKELSEIIGQNLDDKIRFLEHQINKLEQEYKQTKKLESIARQEEKERLKKELVEIIQEKDKNLLLLAHCLSSKKIKFDGKNITRLEAYTLKYRTGAAHGVLKKYNIEDRNIRTFYRLIRRNDDEIIPNVFLEGKDLGYPGYYLKKLDKRSDEDSYFL